MNYRIWNKLDNKYISEQDLSNYYSIDYSGLLLRIDLAGYVTYPDHLIVQFWTGLLDISADKIYEGDIIRAYIDCGPAGHMQFEYEVEIDIFGPNIEEWTYKEDGVLPVIIGNKLKESV